MTKSYASNQAQTSSIYNVNYLNSNVYSNSQETSKNQIYSTTNTLQNENSTIYNNSQQNNSSNFNNQTPYFPTYSSQEYVNQNQHQYQCNINSNINNSLTSQNLTTVTSQSALNGNFHIKKPLTESLLNQLNERDVKKKSSIGRMKDSKINSKLEAKALDKQRSISESVSPLSNAYSSSFISSNDDLGQCFITDNEEQSDNVENTDDEEEDGDDESEMDESDDDDEEDVEPREKKTNSAWNKNALSAPWIQPGKKKKI